MVKVLLVSGVSEEEVGYAAGVEVASKSVNSASRMNSAAVIFLDDVSKVERVVESFGRTDPITDQNGAAGLQISQFKIHHLSSEEVFYDP